MMQYQRPQQSQRFGNPIATLLAGANAKNKAMLGVGNAITQLGQGVRSGNVAELMASGALEGMSSQQAQAAMAKAGQGSVTKQMNTSIANLVGNKQKQEAAALIENNALERIGLKASIDDAKIDKKTGIAQDIAFENELWDEHLLSLESKLPNKTKQTAIQQGANSIELEKLKHENKMKQLGLSSGTSGSSTTKLGVKEQGLISRERNKLTGATQQKYSEMFQAGGFRPIETKTKDGKGKIVKYEYGGVKFDTFKDAEKAYDYVKKTEAGKSDIINKMKYNPNAVPNTMFLRDLFPQQKQSPRTF